MMNGDRADQTNQDSNDEMKSRPMRRDAADRRATVADKIDDSKLVAFDGCS